MIHVCHEAGKERDARLNINGMIVVKLPSINVTPRH
jgi:hypothetical protein